MSMNDFIGMLNDNQKKALLKALLDNSPTLDVVPKEVQKETKKIIQSSLPPTASVKEDFTMHRQDDNSNIRRKEAVRARRNDWQDNGEFRDIETPQFERTPRKRQPHKKVEVECHVCGKMFKEDPRYVHGDYYRCNRCTGK